MRGSGRRIDFERINGAALSDLPKALRRWLPDGLVLGEELVARNPTRADRRPVSFKINVKSGMWADFATGDHGGDPVSLVAYLEGCAQAEAARRLAAVLGIRAEARSCGSLLFAGDGEQACAAAERALRIDPQFTNGPYLNLLGTSKFISEKYEEAIEAYRRNVAQGGPIGPTMLHGWAASYVAAGRMEEARRTASELLKFFPEFSLSRFRMLHMYAKPEDSQRLIGYLRQAGLPD